MGTYGYYKNPAYPIVLAHGIARFDVLMVPFVKRVNRVLRNYSEWFDRHHYFRGIASHLLRNRIRTYHANVSFAESVQERAGDLAAEVHRILQTSRGKKVHIIAHSMGGLDTRHMLLTPGMDDKVASLTTIGTPHHGSSFADWGVQLTGEGPHVKGVLELIQIAGFTDLTSQACIEFNEQAQDREARNEVAYQTYAAYEERKLVFLPLQVPWEIIQEREGDNDGLVSVRSQRWTERLIASNGKEKKVKQEMFPLPADHLNEIGWWDPNELRQGGGIRIDIPRARKQYENKVKEIYLHIADELISGAP